MIEAILPISNREAVRQHLARAHLLLKSLELFWSDSRKLIMHVIAPDHEIDAISSEISGFGIGPRIEIRFCSETQLSPIIGRETEGMGYAKQMLIKMAAFEIVEAPFFIIFDTDVVCCRAFNHETFIQGGRAISAWEVPTLHQWWFESARITNIAIPENYFGQPRLGITPQILSCDLLRIVTSHLSMLFGENWIAGLLSRYTGRHPDIWTEYTLYDLIANKLGLLTSFHVPFEEISPTSIIHYKEQSVWTAEDFQSWDPAALLDNPGLGHFTVLQSITANDLAFKTVKKKWENAVTRKFPAYQS